MAAAALLVTLAVAGPVAAVALASGPAPATNAAATVAVYPQGFHPGRTTGLLKPNPMRSAASIVGAVATTLVVVFATVVIILTLDRRSRMRLQVLEGQGESGQSPPAEGRSDRSKAA